jgi:hypothetical protein
MTNTSEKSKTPGISKNLADRVGMTKNYGPYGSILETNSPTSTLQW